jgi:Fungal Zn(2)-Cys(6) binuclear cluster domain
MAPPPNAAAAAAAATQQRRRQSCDRCHGQKLRCIRAGNSDTGACNRCIRQSAQCVYSSSLPKGRPSMYRLAGISSAPSNPPAVTPATPSELRHRHPAGLHTATADTEANGNGNADANMNEDTTLAEPIDTSTSTCKSTSTSTWPWLASLNWNDLQVDGSEQESSQWTSNADSKGNPQADTSATFLDTFPSLLDWAATGNGDGDGTAREGAPSPTRPHEHGHGHGCNFFESGSSGSSMIIDKNGPDVGIARLSQLSTLLYPLHCSSCTLAETAGSSRQSREGSQARQSPLIGEATFKSVSAWIFHVPADVNLLFRGDGQKSALETTTTGDTLHDAFSASRQLLEILRCLQGDVVTDSLPLSSALSTSTSSCTSTGGAHLDFWASITSPFAQSTSASNENTSYFEQGKVSSSYARSSQYSNSVVRHLVMACHTLLFNIYVAQLIALQHDADLRSSCLPTDDSADGAELADIRLVLVVQLCSYLIERQRQAVDLYLSGPPASTTGNREVMSHLDTEVQQRLKRLRQTLRI